jgi:hypothetical protein
MFFYSKGETFNVVAALDELETGVLLLSQPGAPFNRDYARWDEYASAIARVMTSGGTLHVTVQPGPAEPPLRGWRGPLRDAPEPYRTRTADGRVGTAVATVELIGLDAKPKTGP